ncbi:hypothetical protein C4D60_Mb09t11570 [Musa balbisiana]|uniref:Large ribosomal subunit protein uL10c n=1 Tax=Musa balbisiana TaxID=52838 RepID=A0A4S8IFQ3_MUSBA|nr:hypothetical protein C4D60_Mb09t11570 [Musa balbisiana]
MASLRSAVSTSLPPIRAAVSRMKKEMVRRELENCHLLAGIWCHGLTVRQLQALRGALPPSAKLIVAKNTLVEKAIAGTRWEPLRPCAKGMNAWLFVHSDEIPPALKPCRDFQRDFKLALNDFTGAVFEGRLYGPDDFQALETMPTRMESRPPCRFSASCRRPTRMLIRLPKELRRRPPLRIKSSTIDCSDGPVLLSAGHQLASKQVLALAALKSMGWCAIYGCFINLNLGLTKSTQTYAVENRFSLLIAILRFQLMIKIEHFYGLYLFCYIGNFTLMYKSM